MEGNSFVAPGHLPLKWNYYGPPGQPPLGYQPRKEASWMTPEIRTELQHRNRLQEVSRKTGNPKDCQEYQAQCGKVQNMIDQSKSSLGLSPAYNSGYGPYTGPNSNGLGSGSGPPEYQNPAHSQGIPVGNQRAAYYHNSTNYYFQINKSKLLSCGPCNRTFYNKQRLDEHLKEHVKCPFPECKLSAHIKVIDQHINNQHMLVNFANLQIDDETWIAERKKRFPTTHRAELRRAEQMEKLKRGEKLGQNKKPFKKDKGKYNQTKTVMKREFGDKTHKDNQKEAAENNSMINAHGESKEDRYRGKTRQKKVRRQEKPTSSPKAFIEVDLFDSDNDVKDGFPAFRGTKQFYESTGEVSYFGNKNLDIVDVDDDMEIVKDADIDISDDEWHSATKDKDTSSRTLVLGGALGALMDAYSDSEEENKDLQVPSQNNEKLEPLPSDSVLHDPSQNLNKGKDQDENKQNLTQNTNTTIRRKTRRQPRNQKVGRRPVVPKIFPFPKRRRTLLEKLLQPDIIHERNVILQCVRFIVKNNFFDMINNREFVEEKNVNEIKVACEQVVIGEKIESITEGRKLGETFGKNGIKEVISKENKTERVEEKEMNIEEIREESDRSEALDIDTKSKTDIGVSNCIGNDKTAIKRNSSSFSITEDDGGYESDKEVLGKKPKNEESAGDADVVMHKGTDSFLRDDKGVVDLAHENIVEDKITGENEASVHLGE